MTTIEVSTTCYNEIRRLLIQDGRGGTFNERSDWRAIDMTGVTIRTKGKAQERQFTKNPVQSSNG